MMMMSQSDVLWFKATYRLRLSFGRIFNKYMKFKNKWNEKRQTSLRQCLRLILVKVDKNPRWNKIDVPTGSDLRSQPREAQRLRGGNAQKQQPNIFTSISFCFLKRFMINMIAGAQTNVYSCSGFVFGNSPALARPLCFRLWGVFPRRQINTAVTFLHPHYQCLMPHL